MARSPGRPPYRDDPQDTITTVLWRPGFYDPSAEEIETIRDQTWMRCQCLTHDQSWWHGGGHCPRHGHETARFCGAHGLEPMWPQQLMMPNPETFDPPLSGAQLAAIEAAREYAG